jgi:cystathionine beta-lyase/cystathionine gamma-synthase
VERRRERGMQTRLIHGAEAADPTPGVSPPIYQTSTFRLATPEEGAELAAQVAPATYYTRYGNPNTKQVEALLSGLERAEAALAVGSGMAAITTALLSNLRAGDHVVAQNTHYTSTLSFLAQVLPRYGVEVTQVDQTDTGAFRRAIRPNTRVVYTETPTNPTMDLTDLSATAEIAHEAGVLAITDNTFASSYNQRPLELGYDLVVHAATKYLGGHSDLTAGVILGPRQLIDLAWEHARVHGPVLHPFEAWLLQRALKTYGLRMEQHNRNALIVARFLEDHPAVERVHYPGLESHLQHELSKKQMVGGFGGMLSFELKGGYDAAYRLIRRTEVCVPAVSLGDVETLITHPASLVYPHNTDEERRAAGVSPGLVRLSVGAEDPEDIIEDLDAALRPEASPTNS